MDSAYQDRLQDTTYGDPASLPELSAWFSVSGDMDDFIFYGEPGSPHSEK